MKLIHITRILLLVLSLVLLAAVLSFTPVRLESRTRDWGGGTYTRHARTGMEPIPGTWDKDTGVLTIELLMIAVLFGLAASPPQEASDAATLLAKAALVVHTGTVLLPIAIAGSDTIWVAGNPVQILLCTIQLVPQTILGIACFQVVRDDGLLPVPDEPYPSSLAYRDWVIYLAFAAAAVWIAWSFTRVPMFVISPFGIGIVLSQPLSGVWSGAVAMWLTLGATTLAGRRCVVPAIPADR